MKQKVLDKVTSIYELLGTRKGEWVTSVDISFHYFPSAYRVVTSISAALTVLYKLDLVERKWVNVAKHTNRNGTVYSYKFKR